MEPLTAFWLGLGIGAAAGAGAALIALVGLIVTVLRFLTGRPEPKRGGWL